MPAKAGIQKLVNCPVEDYSPLLSCLGNGDTLDVNSTQLPDSIKTELEDKGVVIQ